jgi:ribonuclease P protein component
MKSGRCFRDPVVRIHYRESGRELSRLGLVVSRRVGNAVTRNRIKRLFRELFRKAKARFDPSLDVVVVPDSRAGPQDRDTYARAFEAFLLRLVPKSRRGAP